MTITIGAVPTAPVLTAFEADIVKVARWVDIYEADNTTVWRSNAAIEGGSVSVDMSRAERRNLDLTVYNADDNIAYGPGGLWYDKIIKPYRGVYLPNGDIWATCLGEFMIDSISRPHFPNNFQITGRDFVKKLQKAKFANTTAFSAGANIGTTIQNIATNGGIVKFNFAATTKTLPAVVTFDRGTERWAACEELAAAAGYELFFNAFGYLTFRPYVDPLTAPLSYSFRDGALSNLAAFTKSTTDNFMYNHVVFYGDGTDNSLVFGEATNTEPSSPTRIAAIGRRMYFRSSAFVPDNTTATANAEAILGVSALEQYDMSLTTIVLPWLEAAEAVEVETSTDVPTDPTRYLLSSFTIPLDLSAMSGSAKRVTIVG